MALKLLIISFCLIFPASLSSVGRPSLNPSKSDKNASSLELKQIKKSANVISSSPYTMRLPGNAKPVKYVLRIRPVLEENPNFELGTAPGVVNISFVIESDTNSIVLHAHNMTIEESQVKLKNLDKNIEVPMRSQERHNHHQRYTITTEAVLMKGENYELSIPFAGSMVNKRVGLYSFTYPDVSEQRMRMAAASQFQPFHAREAFPCFDEPQFRAEFQVGIARMEKYQSFSNTALNTTIPCQTPGWVWDMYDLSPPMPASLVNLVVVDGYSSAVADESIVPNKKIQVWAPKPLIDQKAGEYGAMLTASMIKHFEEYFDFPYVLRKLDSILVWQTDGPAMEHWGSITYGLGGASLLYFPGATPEWKRFNVASLVAHEVLHQWIGNLISCDWWSDIWIHEGFADFFADEAVAKLQPEFQSDVIFINSHIQRALKADQSPETHAVNHIFSMTKFSPAEDDEGTDAFDDIAYSKGASLVRMLRNILTEPVFKEGLRNFIKMYAFQAVNQTHLFGSFNMTTHLPTTVKQIMETWTYQAGYPLVRVHVKSDSSIELLQEKFTTRMKKEDANATKWWIPVKVTSASNPIMAADPPQYWMDQLSDSLVLDKNIDPTKWLIVNPDATGFFRVLYDKKIYAQIKQQLDLDHTVFSPITRSQLIDDYFTFANHKYVEIEEALELISYLHKEKELVVWNTVLLHLKTAINMFRAHTDFDGLQKYLVAKIDAVLSMPDVGMVQESQDKGITVLLRMELLKHSCMLRSATCEKHVLSMISDWMEHEDKNTIPVDLQPVVYCAGVAAGDKKVWEFMKKMHDRTPPSEQKMFLFKALSCTRDTSILEMFMEGSWQPSSTYSTLDALEVMADNPLGNTLVLQTLKANYDKIRPIDFVRIVNIMSDYWVHPDLIAELETFANSQQDVFQSLMLELKAEIDIHKANEAWMKTTGKEMDVWFNSHSVI